jgi:hypothetical protein
LLDVEGIQHPVVAGASKWVAGASDHHGLQAVHAGFRLRFNAIAVCVL